MRKKQVGSYLVTEETGYIKVTHESKAFNFRMAISDEGCNQFFKALRDAETLEAYGAVLAAINVSSVMAIQNADFALRLIGLINGQSNPDVSDVEDAEIIKEEKALYELEHEDTGLQPE